MGPSVSLTELFTDGTILGALFESVINSKTRFGGQAIHSLISNPDILFSLIKLTRFRLRWLDGQINIRKVDADIVLDMRITVHFERYLSSEPEFARGDQRVIHVHVRLCQIIERTVMPAHPEGPGRNRLAANVARGVAEFGDLYAHIKALLFRGCDRRVILGKAD